MHWMRLGVFVFSLIFFYWFFFIVVVRNSWNSRSFHVRLRVGFETQSRIAIAIIDCLLAWCNNHYLQMASMMDKITDIRLRKGSLMRKTPPHLGRTGLALLACAVTRLISLATVGCMGVYYAYIKEAYGTSHFETCLLYACALGMLQGAGIFIIVLDWTVHVTN